MDLKQILARLVAIQAELKEIQEQKGENGFTDEQGDSINALSDEFEKLGKQKIALERLAATQAAASASAGRQTSGAQPTVVAVEVGKDLSMGRFGGFKSTGEYLKAVHRAGLGTISEKDRKLFAVANESSGEDGGFLVPEEMSSAILKKLDSEDSLMARATVIPVSGNNLSINVDETTPWTGGITAAWVAEQGTIGKSQPKFKQVDFKLQKLAALVPVTDELLEDAVALEGYISALASNAITHEVNQAITQGSGSGKPNGILTSPFTVTVTAESAQDADTVNATNVIKMYSKMLPRSRSNAIWLIHPEVEAQLYQMRDPEGHYIYLAPGSQMNQTPYATLLGRPVIVDLGAKELGAVGDIMFADLSAYYMIRKASGIKAATSIHLQFDKDITNYKFVLRLDGKSPFSSPVTTKNGSYTMSSFVVLSAR